MERNGGGNGREVVDMKILKKIREAIENIRAAVVMEKGERDEQRKDRNEKCHG